MKKALFFCLIITLLLIAKPLLAASPLFYFTIEGTNQGLLHGESHTAGHEAEMEGLAFNYELKIPTDKNTGAASGYRQHSPVTITKLWGAASPQILQALANGEKLKKVTIKFYKAAGWYYTITLTGGIITSIKQHKDLVLDQTANVSSGPELEDISITFEKITVKDEQEQTQSQDDWARPRK